MAERTREEMFPVAPVIDLMQELKASLRPDASARDWPEDFGYENGNYQCHCIHCEQPFMGYKRRVTCKVCSQLAAGFDPAKEGQ